MSEEKYKIFFFPLPMWGHVYPITGMVHELAINRKHDVHVFANLEHKKIIESAGATYRQYSYFPTDEFKRSINKNNDSDVIYLSYLLLDVTDHMLPNLIDLIENEKPDLVIHDGMAYHIKCLYEILQRRSIKTPPFIAFQTSFACKNGIYPNKIESNLVSDRGMFFYIKMIRSFIKQLSFNYKYGLSILNTERHINKPNENMNIVAVLPDLQPKAHLFDKSFQFVGCCIQEKVRIDIKNDFQNEKLEIIMDLFENRGDPLIDINYLDNKIENHLIYVSLGTLFNDNVSIFEKIIESIPLFDKYINYNFRSKDLKAVFSLGQNVYNSFQDKINNSNYFIPDNVFLFEAVPQIEILKRASLFITHSGMNGISEAVHFGVPLICIPVKADQPRIAYRVTDELGFGIRLDPLNLEPKMITDSINKVLTDKLYLQRVRRYSSLSKTMDGNRNAADICVKLIRESNKKIA